jgi:hypothetical protein
MEGLVIAGCGQSPQAPGSGIEEEDAMTESNRPFVPAWPSSPARWAAPRPAAF